MGKKIEKGKRDNDGRKKGSMTFREEKMAKEIELIKE